MRSLEESLTQYAACHRDRRNIATHFFGVPLIVFAIVLALALASIRMGGMAITAAAIASIAASVYYVMLDRTLGATMAVALFVMCAAASEITARAPAGAVLALAAFLFAAGWALQFWGHRFEGIKPAFLDDVKQLFIGPIFVCAEAFFLFGAKPELRRHIEARVGPAVARRVRSGATQPR